MRDSRSSSATRCTSSRRFQTTSSPSISRSLAAPSSGSTSPIPDPRAVGIACCDVVNRGASFGDGKIIYSLLDATVVAVDAETGKEAWRTRVGDINKGETFTGGADRREGSRAGRQLRRRARRPRLCGGSRSQYRQGTVARVQHRPGCRRQDRRRRFMRSTPRTKERISASPRGRRSNGSWADPRSGDGSRTTRRRISSSMARAIRASGIPICGRATTSGRRRSLRAMPTRARRAGPTRSTAHDSWDYDEIMENMLVDMDYGGRPRKLIVHPGPHRLRLRPRSRDRRAAVGGNIPTDELGERLRSENRQGARGSRQADPLRYRDARDLPLVHGRQGRHSVGVFATHGPALHPRPQHLHGLRGHRGELHRGHAVPRRRREDVSGARRVSGRARRVGRRAQPQGLGRSRKTSFPCYSGVLATGGDVVFYGTMDGWFKAVDARTGTELWKFHVASGIVANPITYLGPDGKQYVAVYAGIGGWMGAVAFPEISADDPYAGARRGRRDERHQEVHGGRKHGLCLRSVVVSARS